MNTLIVLCLLLVGLTLCNGRIGQCNYRYTADGRKADCGGFVGKQCSYPTDRCQYLPNADFGYCCMRGGCRYGQSSGPCTLFRGCRYGESCQRGVCCPSHRG